MRKRVTGRGTTLIIALGGLLAVTTWAATSWLHARQADSMPGNPANARTLNGADVSLTLDPELFKGEVREAYAIARRNPALLAALHCYCGCDRAEGHRNLLDCYRDQHGAHCEICTGEVIEAERLLEQGTPVEQIRDVLRTKYDRGH
jgi:hypothetical protein